jgi:ubiquinone/menaquinone biosynthesis C-methylase UbiE
VSAEIENHYGGPGELAQRIRRSLIDAGKDMARLTPEDIAAVDEFHVRGRQATLELARRMRLEPDSRVLDLGSGLGGAARTVAQTYGCSVTGIDLTRSFCDAADEMSRWLGLSDKVRFVHGDATDPPVEPASFDAAMTIHAAMNIAAKDRLYAAARRALKPRAVFAVYDVLQGEGGAVRFPVPWARDPSISHLATPAQMGRLLAQAGFEILEEIDSSEESLAWFARVAARIAEAGRPPVTFQTFLGGDFPQMARNQVRNLAERRIRTVTYVCQA